MISIRLLYPLGPFPSSCLAQTSATPKLPAASGPFSLRYLLPRNRDEYLDPLAKLCLQSQRRILALDLADPQDSSAAMHNKGLNQVS